MDKMKSLLNKNKLVLLGLSVFTLLLIIGTSFALYQIVNTQTEENLVDVGCFNVGITKQENAINLENAYPISDEKGKSLTPFTFTLTNNCNVTGKYTVNLEVLKDSTMSTSFVKTLVNNGTISKLDALPKAETKNSGSIEARTIASGILTPNSSVDYSVSLWMDENVTIEDGAMNKILKSKIVVISKALSQLTSDDPIAQNIIAQLDTTGKCPKVNADGTMQLTDAETGSGYLCSAPDNYGTSYYYRGDVTNNYVQFGKWPDDTPDVVYGYYARSDDGSIPSSETFSSMDECQKDQDYNSNCTIVSRKGKPMYWRIVRLNGDGSFRLAYAGTSPYENNQVSPYKEAIQGEISGDITDQKAQVAAILSLYDNAGAGYMFGDPEGVVETSKIIGHHSSSSTIKIAKSYSLNEDHDFNLVDQIEIDGSKITDDYLGYYTFFSKEESGMILNKIASVDTENGIGYTELFYGTKSKEQAQTNKNDSIYKLIVDQWYKSVLNNTKYEKYLSDNIYCNYRSISTSYLDGTATTNLGYGREYTLYRWGTPIISTLTSIYDFYLNNYKADSVSTKLLCTNKNDAFTVDDNLNGNANLTYPIGMLTADEATLAGAYYGKENKNFYLYSGNFSFLVDPIIIPYALKLGIKAALNNSGSLVGGSYAIMGYGITPIINLESGSLNFGDGTKDNPYKILEVDESSKININYYINDNISTLEPSAFKKDRYTLQKVECDNGVTGTWNTDTWSLETSSTTTNSTCNVYFNFASKVYAKYYNTSDDSSITLDYAKLHGYSVDKITCDNNETATWNNEKWELETSNSENDINCKVYFKSPTIKIANSSLSLSSNCPTVNSDGSVSITYLQKTNSYLCAAQDAYGTSFYYRGNVTNNYVKFANFYWRIVRINGDGSIRLIYDGTSAHANGESSTDRQVAKGVFNSSGNDNAYVGYMYGKLGAYSYVETHANKNNSTIKTYLDNWYKNNIIATSNEMYVSDNIFCNDRTLVTRKPSDAHITYGNLGYGKNSTPYRWYDDASSSYNNKMKLTCSQKNDAFTVSDVTNGNGALTYPIGLLSDDEIVLAGGWTSENNGFYLYTGQAWWTMSPYSYDDLRSWAYVKILGPNGATNYLSEVVGAQNSGHGIRPVINLKANALKAGTGTADDPYRIS